MTTKFKPANQNERLLSALPVKCTCHACMSTRAHLEKEIGKKRFNEICRKLNNQ